ncbi:hypothetical protein [Methanosphaerula subterraneus]|uniref:hypothetical protein n=1 Tax=Methanosphaerula subterraneus TaxID=3350244 RepID=UPI003F827A3D
MATITFFVPGIDPHDHLSPPDDPDCLRCLDTASDERENRIISVYFTFRIRKDQHGYLATIPKNPIKRQMPIRLCLMIQNSGDNISLICPKGAKYLIVDIGEACGLFKKKLEALITSATLDEIIRQHVG